MVHLEEKGISVAKNKLYSFLAFDLSIFGGDFSEEVVLMFFLFYFKLNEFFGGIAKFLPFCLKTILTFMES